MTKDEALYKALKVLNCLNNDRVFETAWVKGAINACEEALEQSNRFEGYTTIELGHKKPAPSWQGLSNDRIREIGDNCLENNNGLFNWINFARAIEQELKEKNNA